MAAALRLSVQPDDIAEPDLDWCRHGRTAGEHCSACDDREPFAWRALSPRALLELPVLFRCPACGSLVIDLDRCLHEEHHTAA